MIRKKIFTGTYAVKTNLPDQRRNMLYRLSKTDLTKMAASYDLKSHLRRPSFKVTFGLFLSILLKYQLRIIYCKLGLLKP